MNIAQAQQIPLRNLVEQLGGRFSHYNASRTEAWYFSPLRPDERTASFKVNENQNTWFDFGHSGTSSNKGGGGDILDLWCDYYQRNRKTDVKDALAALSHFGSIQTGRIKPSQNVVKEVVEPKWKILKLQKIFYPSLKEEISKRKISKPLAELYLKQAYLQFSDKPDKRYNGLVFENWNDGGAEICIPNPIKGTCFKTGILKAPSYLPGKFENKASVFEGFWDFLTWMELHNFMHPPHDCFVLNSNSFIEQVADKIESKKTIEVVSSYLDNDESGRLGTQNLAIFLEPSGIVLQDLSGNYKDYKDISDFWRYSTSTSRTGFVEWLNPHMTTKRSLRNDM